MNTHTYALTQATYKEASHAELPKPPFGRRFGLD